jgi:hypothetical protein
MKIYLFMKTLNPKLFWIIYWCELSPLDCKGPQLTMVYTYKQKHFKKEELEDTKGVKRKFNHPSSATYA